MRRLNEDLKSGRFSQIYLLYGTEQYLKLRFSRSLEQAILPNDDGMNRLRFDGKITDVTELINTCDTLPFFAERRLVVVKDSGLFAAAGNEAARLAAYLPDMPASTHLLFVEDDVKKTTKLYKAVAKAGYCAELTAPDEKMLTAWLNQELRARGTRAETGVVSYLLQKVGNDMCRLETELEKASSYCMDKGVLTREDVDAVCTPHISNHIFEMMEDMAGGRTSRALARYDELVRLRESPRGILRMFISQYTLLWHVYAALAQTDTPARAARLLGQNEYRVKKLAGWRRLYSRGDVRRILDELADTERDINRGVITDALAVELFIISQAGRNQETKEQQP